MTIYVERNSLTLLNGATDPDGDPISVRRLNGTLISSWPHIVDLTIGSVIVAQDGTVTFDDEQSTSQLPGGGQTVANGSFTFRLWDGALESPTYTASVSLSGMNSNPIGQNHTLVFEV